MSAFPSAAPPPQLPLITDVPNYTGHSYVLTLYMLSDVPPSHYSADDNDFYNNFDADGNAGGNAGDVFKSYLRDTISSRDTASLSNAKKILCNEWINAVTINKYNTINRANLMGIIEHDICGHEMDAGFLSNKYAELKQMPHVGVLVMLVSIITNTLNSAAQIESVFCLSFSTVRIQNNPVLVINGVCTQKRYRDGCPLYAFLFYKAVEHCITSVTGMNVITILSALAEAVPSYLRAGFSSRVTLDPKNWLRQFMKYNFEK